MSLSTTRAIILRSVRYGDTSLIATMYTEQYGLQAYLLQGVRGGKPGRSKAHLYQPGNVLELVVYHHPQKNLQRIREGRHAYIWQQLPGQIIRQSLLIFLVELMLKTLTEPEPHTELFDWAVKAIQDIDRLPAEQLANYPFRLVFELSAWLGFGLQNSWTPETPVADLLQGMFVSDSQAPYTVGGPLAQLLGLLLESDQPLLLKVDATQRKQLLQVAIQYLGLHLSRDVELKSVQILQEVLHA